MSRGIVSPWIGTWAVVQSIQSVTENFNTQSAEGRLFLQLLGSFAEFERKRIGERCMSGKISTAKRGGWNGGRVPYGYQRAGEGFIIQPQEAEIVKRIFKLYSQGLGYLKIKNLTGCPLSVRGTSKVLNNPFYHGKIRFTGIVSPNQHPSLVSEKLFKKCQKIHSSK